MSLRLGMGIAVVASTVIPTACSRGSIDFVNDSDTSIVIVQIVGEDERVLDEIAGTGGFSILSRWFDGCLEGDLEARLEDGTVVEARPGPFCPGDPAWIITEGDVERARDPRD